MKKSETRELWRELFGWHKGDKCRMPKFPLLECYGKIVTFATMANNDLYAVVEYKNRNWIGTRRGVFPVKDLLEDDRD